MDLYVISRNIQLFGVGGWGDFGGLLFSVAFTFGEGLQRHAAPGLPAGNDTRAPRPQGSCVPGTPVSPGFCTQGAACMANPEGDSSEPPRYGF